MLYDDFDGALEEGGDTLFPVLLTASTVVLGRYQYTWIEQTFDAGTGTYSSAISPRTGTAINGPYMVEINNNLVSVPAYAWARLRGRVNATPLYEFSLPSPLPLTTLGDTLYEDATPTPVRLPGNITTTQMFLAQTGTGSSSAPPSWVAISADEVTIHYDTSGALQVETATVVGSITANGTATVIITSSILPGSPVTYSVPVTTALSTASLVAAAIRAYLATQSALTNLYTVGGSGATITLTTLSPAPNDSTLNIATADGTCTGLTSEPTSANTTAGKPADVFSIDVTYPGQTSITTLGTVATGNWQATKIGQVYGGTNIDSSGVTDGQLFIGSTSGNSWGVATLTQGTGITITNAGHSITISGLVSPLTTKGDIWGFSTLDARIPVGTDTYVLTADSAQTLGVKWAPAGGGSSISYTTTATAGSTTTLTSSSTTTQYFTGSSTQTIVMPVTSTLTLGQSFQIVNRSTGALTVQSSGSNTIVVISPNSSALLTVTSTSGTGASSWDASFDGATSSLLTSGYTTTATAAGTTTLTNTSNPNQYFTGSSTQTVALPVAATMTLGQGFTIVNDSTGVVTVQSSGGNTVATVPAGTQAGFACILTSGTTAASWDQKFTGATATTGSGSVVLGTSPTLGSAILTTPTINGTPTGTGVATAGTASTLVLRDANGNVTGNSFLSGSATTATAAGTTTLTVSSKQQQYFTGVLTQTVVLPVTSTLILGQVFQIVNQSTGVVTVQSSGGNTIAALAAGASSVFAVTSISGTTAASWNAQVTPAPPTGSATTYLDGTGAYSTPAGSGITALTGDVTASGSGSVAATIALSVSHAWTAQQYFAQATLTDGTSIAWNLATQQAAKVTLGGNRTLANPSNLVAGGTYTLIVVQDGTGSRTLAYGTDYKWPAGTAPTLSTAAGTTDILTFISDGSSMFGVAQKGFA